MRIGLLTRNENNWSSVQLREAIIRQNINFFCFDLQYISAGIGTKQKASISNMDLLDYLDAIIVRPIGQGSLDRIIFRMDVLHRIERLGIPIVNSPKSIERSIDKYHALALLEESGVPVPRTIATENIDEAMKAFYDLSEDVVIKPIFGSRGIGSARISDPDIAFRVFRAILFSQGVIYIQEFIPHGLKDIRAFVIGDHVFASMYRLADTWKTNISQGAKPSFLKLNEEMENLAVEAARIIGVEVTGVDLLEGPEGPVIIELNSQPGWKGLQSVTPKNIADGIVRYVASKLD